LRWYANIFNTEPQVSLVLANLSYSKLAFLRMATKKPQGFALPRGPALVKEVIIVANSNIIGQPVQLPISGATQFNFS
jgi:hypothetical protein